MIAASCLEWKGKQASPICFTACHHIYFSYAENLNLCIDNWGNLAHCANNCLGVDPNAVVIGGSAILASAIGGLGVIQSVITVGAITTVGAGGMAVAMGVCPPPFCQVCMHFIK